MLQLIVHGKSNKDIAVVLGLSVNTVAVHRANIMQTLDIHNTAELVVYAIRNGTGEHRVTRRDVSAAGALRCSRPLRPRTRAFA